MRRIQTVSRMQALLEFNDKQQKSESDRRRTGPARSVFYDDQRRGVVRRVEGTSSRLGQQYRVLYRIEKEKIRVEVVTVTAHDYRRKS